MVAWWVAILINIGLTLAYELLRPKPDFDSPDPSGLSDFKIPTIGEGRVIPMVWGTCKLTGPMVTWYGDLEVVAIKEWVQTGLFTGEHMTTGYRYYLGMQLVLCSGEIDDVSEVYFDNIAVNELTGDEEGGWTPHAESNATRLRVNARELFGGEDQDGGVDGTIWVYHGNYSQDPDEYLEEKLGVDLPAWRGIVYAVFRHVYLGVSPYIKDFALTVTRFPNSLGLEGGDEEIDGDANPAAIIYDLLTSSPGKNGLGIPSGSIDSAGFRTVGATLASEGLGLSMVLDNPTSAKDMILDVLRHIDGTVYVEPSTGLLTLDLVRFDYDEETIPVLDETNCIVESFGRSSWGEVKNQIRVQYTDRADGFILKTVQAQDLAAIEASGGELSTQTISLRGISNATNAQNAAAKALAGLAYPLASLSITGNREHWALRPGSVFKLNWPKLGIVGLVARVTKIGKGELISGAIEFEAIEDYFAVSWAAYTPPGGSDWEDPAGYVPALTDQDAFLAPYEAVKTLSVPEGGAQQALVVAARGAAGVSKGFNAIVDDVSKRFAWFTPSGTLQSGIDETSTTITVDMGPDSEYITSANGANFDAGSNVAFLAGGTSENQTGLEEFIAFETVSIDEVLGEITLTGLARGCLDTAPTVFGSDTRIWFLSYGSGVVNIEGSGSTEIKFQAYNNLGGYDLDLCPTDSPNALTNARRSLVYCPTGVEFNAASYPTSISGELVVSWTDRDRLGEWGYSTSGATSSPETGTTYTIKVYGESDTLIHTEPDLTTTTWTYLEADEISESGLGRLNTSLRVEVYTYRVGVAALRMIEWSFSRT